MSPVASATHSAVYRRAGSALQRSVTRDLLIARLRGLGAALQTWLPGFGVDDGAWIEMLPFESSDPRARELCERLQRCRIEERAESPVRVSALLYQDGSLDLVVAANASRLGRTGVQQLAAGLLDGAEFPVGQAGHGPVTTRATAPTWISPDPDWASGGGMALPVDLLIVERPLPLDLPDGIDVPAAVAAALAQALAVRTRASSVAMRVELPAPVAGAVPWHDVPCVVVVPTAGTRPADPLGYAMAWHATATAASDLSTPVAAVLQWPLDEVGGGGRWRTLDDAPLRVSVGSREGGCGGFVEVLARPEFVSAQAAEALADDLVLALSSPAAEASPRSLRIEIAAQPAARNLHELVASTCERQGDAEAVVGRSGRLTYAQLRQQADAVAGGLRAAGCGRGDLVGVCMSRDVGFVVAMLGVMAAGAAYVPLDPSYPDERLRYTVQDAMLALVIVELPRVALGGVPQWHISADGTILEDTPPVGAVRASEKAAPAGCGDVAYVIYTSGSTGKPKGAMIEHSNVLALIEGCTTLFALGPSDTWTCFHSFAFDFSVWEVWGCLATGGRLVVVSEAEARVPGEFLRLVSAERVTILNQTPSAFAQLVVADESAPAELALRLVILGGEALQPRILLRWFNHHGEDTCDIVNMYGITETTVHCTWKRFTRMHALRDDRSIGVPIPGWTAHVLDAEGRSCATGVPGEIWIGGAGVGRGYLARPGLTATRFRAAPVPGALGQRLYRSGDRGRRRADGELEYLGRLDHQVKVRGYRIELGEIRARLLEAPGVQDAAVVVARRGEAADAFIDAYIVGPDVSVTALRRRLVDELPAYMVPATLTRLDALPLTINGKVDQRRLTPATSSCEEPVSAMTLGTSSAGGARTSPSPADDATAAMESRVAAIWRQVLGIDVGLDDNFFLVGGNSLLAIRVTRRIQDDAIAQATARHLYSNPTVRELCAALRAGR